MNLSKLNLKQIYRFLIEEITFNEEENNTRTLKPLRVETGNLSIKWDKIWLSSRQSMLGPNLRSLLFKLLHQILPTAERVNRIFPNQSPFCSICPKNETETLEHTLLVCPGNQGAGTVLYTGLRKYAPDLTMKKMMTIDFDSAQEEQEFSLVWITGTFLSKLWQLRVEKKRVELS